MSNVDEKRRDALLTPDGARVRFFIHFGSYCLREVGTDNWWLLSAQGDGWLIHKWNEHLPPALPPAPEPVEHEYHWHLASTAVHEAIDLAEGDDHVPILESLLASNAMVTG